MEEIDQFFVVAQAHALYFADNRRADAVTLMEAAAERYPEDDQIQGFLGFLYSQEERFEDAIPVFDALIARNPAKDYLRNLTFCRTSLAWRIMEGRPASRPQDS
jgi:cytochrome c-type biogenesis protein CcmH/NrfG